MLIFFNKCNFVFATYTELPFQVIKKDNFPFMILLEKLHYLTVYLYRISILFNNNFLYICKVKEKHFMVIVIKK